MSGGTRRISAGSGWKSNTQQGKTDTWEQTYWEWWATSLNSRTEKASSWGSDHRIPSWIQSQTKLPLTAKGHGWNPLKTRHPFWWNTVSYLNKYSSATLWGALEVLPQSCPARSRAEYRTSPVSSPVGWPSADCMQARNSRSFRVLVVSLRKSVFFTVP